MGDVAREATSAHRAREQVVASAMPGANRPRLGSRSAAGATS